MRRTSPSPSSEPTSYPSAELRDSGQNAADVPTSNPTAPPDTSYTTDDGGADDDGASPSSTPTSLSRRAFRVTGSHTNTDYREPSRPANRIHDHPTSNPTAPLDAASGGSDDVGSDDGASDDGASDDGGSDDEDPTSAPTDLSRRTLRVAHSNTATTLSMLQCPLPMESVGVTPAFVYDGTLLMSTLHEPHHLASFSVDSIRQLFLSFDLYVASGRVYAGDVEYREVMFLQSHDDVQIELLLLPDGDDHYFVTATLAAPGYPTVATRPQQGSYAPCIFEMTIILTSTLTPSTTVYSEGWVGLVLEINAAPTVFLALR